MSLIKEIFIKQKERPTYSASMIQYVLHLHYT